MDLQQVLKLSMEAFGRQMVSLVTASLIALVGLGVLTFLATLLAGPLTALVVMVGASLVFGGLFTMGNAVVSEQPIDIADIFDPLQERPLDYIVAGVVLQLALPLLGVGVIFLFAPLLVAEGESFGDALNHSKAIALEHIGEVVVFALLMFVLNGLVIGATCGFGACVALPFTALATIRVYHQLIGRRPPDVSIPPPRGSARPSARPSGRPSARPSSGTAGGASERPSRRPSRKPPTES